MTPVLIIEIDLGSDISDIIKDDLSQLTQRNRDDVDAAIAESKTTSRIREAKEKTEQSQEEATQTAFQSIYDADRQGQTVAGKDLLIAAQPHIASMNSLVQRLKTFIRAKKLPYLLKSIRRGKDSYYYLQAPSEDEPTPPNEECAD